MSGGTTPPLLRRVIARFRQQSLATRGYIALRHRLLPAEHIASLVPPGGKVIDLCCGYGSVAMLLALGDRTRQVIGIDMDSTRIAVARQVSADVPNLRFECGDVLAFRPGNAETVLMLDSLHYFAPDTQLELLRRIRSWLPAGGMLVCREVIRSRSLRFVWNWLHERLMVGLRFTRSNDQTTSFDSLATLTERFRQAGLDVRRVEGPRGWHPYADHILVAIAV